MSGMTELTAEAKLARIRLILLELEKQIVEAKKVLHAEQPNRLKDKMLEVS